MSALFTGRQSSLSMVGGTLMIGLAIRLVLIAYSEWHDATFEVRFTDVDYSVITDGAQMVLDGRSPFDRTTYRYTPLLAFLMVPNLLLVSWFGKVIFALTDVMASLVLYHNLKMFIEEASAKRWMLFVLYNPIVINVSTRGNADMLISLLILLVVMFYNERKFLRAAAILGFAIHFKLYPVIYVPALVFGTLKAGPTSPISPTARSQRANVSTIVGCAVFCALGFIIPTFLCYMLYGQRYLFESIFYHLSRVDHRHNLSPYFYPLYLQMATVAGPASNIMAFVPQLIMLVVVAFKLRHNVGAAVCLQTILFVAFNKVSTVQYFIWYIPLLPLLMGRVRITAGGMVVLFAPWVATLVLWMLVAYQLEFAGNNVFFLLWVCSCLFFLSQVWVAFKLVSKLSTQQSMKLHF